MNEEEFTLLKSADGIAWINLGMDARNGMSNYVEKKGVTQFSRITLSTNQPDGRLRTGNFPGESFATWPNPVVEIVTLGVNAAQPANMKVLIYDGKGALVHVQDARLGAGINQVKVNMNKLPQGNYSIHANYDGKTKISRVNKM